jgi:hypothetical protein
VKAHDQREGSAAEKNSEGDGGRGKVVAVALKIHGLFVVSPLASAARTAVVPHARHEISQFSTPKLQEGAREHLTGKRVTVDRVTYLENVEHETKRVSHTLVVGEPPRKEHHRLGEESGLVSCRNERLHGLVAGRRKRQ